MKNTLSALRDLLIIVSVILFYLGWIFEYFYLYFLGVSMLEINYQIYSFYLYSINVIFYIFSFASISVLILWLLLLIIAVALIWLIIHENQELLTIATSFLPFFFVVFLFSWLIGGFFLARSAALEATIPIINGTASVTVFEFKNNGSLAGANLQEHGSKCPDSEEIHIRRICNGILERRLHLIAKSANNYIVYYNPKGSDEKRPMGAVYYIPAIEVAAAATYSSHYSVARR